MEKEFTDPGPYYYSGSGQFYSPQFVRSLSEAGQTSASGPGCGPAGNAIAGPSSVSVSGFDPTNLNNDERSAESVGGGAAAGALAGALIGTEGGPIGWLVGAAIGASIGATVSFFEAIFGGSSDTPPTPRKLLHGRHPLYPLILGLPEGEVPDEVSAGMPQLSGDVQFTGTPPLSTSTPTPGPSPTPAGTPTPSQSWQTWFQNLLPHSWHTPDFTPPPPDTPMPGGCDRYRGRNGGCWEPFRGPGKETPVQPISCP